MYTGAGAEQQMAQQVMRSSKSTPMRGSVCL